MKAINAIAVRERIELREVAVKGRAEIRPGQKANMRFHAQNITNQWVSQADNAPYLCYMNRDLPLSER